MNKQECITELKNKLFCLPYQDIEKSVEYYSEIIDDSVEDGMSEEDAVASLGDIDEIVSQILMETPITTLVKEKVKQGRTLQAWEIILLVLGSPIWLSILIALFSVVLALYITIWSVVISLYAVVLSVAVGIFISLIKGLFLNALIFFAFTLIATGLTILLFIGTNYFTKGVICLSKSIVKGIKSIFVGRRAK